MPQMNITIDNINPQILYQPVGAWIEGDDVADKLGVNYSQGTFTLCQTRNSAASFNFNGTGIWVFGAKRENHGPYSVELDGVTNAFDGQYPDPGLFQYPLFSATSLKEQSHNLVITNLETDPNHTFLDIDFITWTADIGNDTDTTTSAVIQDTDSAFSYSPASSWTTDIQNLPGFSGNTGHSTFSGDAYVTFTFSGDAVSLYGAVGPSASPYDVQLDNHGPFSFNATKRDYHFQVMLYRADNLGPGSHTLNVTNKPTSFGEGLSIDYAIVDTVASSSGNSSGSGSGGRNSGNAHKTSLGVGAIVGIVVGSIAIVIALLVFFLSRRRKRVHAQPETSVYPLADSFPTRPTNGSMDGSVIPFVSQNSDGVGTTSHTLYPLEIPSQSTASPYSGFRSASSGLSTPWRSDGTSSNSYQAVPTNAVHKPPLHLHNPSSSTNNISIPHSPPTAPTSDGSSTGRSNTNEAPQPAVVVDPLTNVREEFRTNRMRVEGREQDFGPVQPVELLPPDYTQATEPYHAPM